MGECGCGDMNVWKAFRIAPNTYLLIEKYLGCRYCGTPLGTVIHVVSRKEALEWVAAEEIEELKPDNLGLREITVPFLDAGSLVKAAEINGMGSDELTEYDSLADVLDECGFSLMQERCRIYEAGLGEAVRS